MYDYHSLQSQLQYVVVVVDDDDDDKSCAYCICSKNKNPHATRIYGVIAAIRSGILHVSIYSKISLSVILSHSSLIACPTSALFLGRGFL